MKDYPLVPLLLGLLTLTLLGCPTKTVQQGTDAGTGGSGRLPNGYGGSPADAGNAGSAGSPRGGSAGDVGVAGSGAAGASGKAGASGASGGSGGSGGGTGGAAGSAFGSGGAGSSGTAGMAGTAGTGGTFGGTGGSGSATACKEDTDCQSTDFCADDTCHHRVAQIACGSRTTCVLLNDGSIWCAGLNASGELGNGTITTTSSAGIDTAVKVVGLPSNDAPKQIAPGGSHTCALLTSGTVYCWGAGYSGQLGNGSFTGSTTPVKVPLAAASKVASGDSFVCAALNDGSVWCWGDDYFGELGDGTFTNGRTDQAKASPVQVGTTLVTAPDALIASTRTAHVLVGFQIFSWGEDKFGELGTGSATTSSPFGSATPVSTPYAGQALAISAASSGDHACMLTNHGIIRCWGNDDYGQLGDGSFAGVGATPNTVTGLTGTPSAVFAGGSHTCAIMTNGDFDCWGDDSFGELGDGVFRDTSQPVTSPIEATVVPSTPVSAALGISHTCVLLKNGSVWCWGANGNGQLGNGMFIDSPTAVRMTGW